MVNGSGWIVTTYTISKGRKTYSKLARRHCSPQVAELILAVQPRASWRGVVGDLARVQTLTVQR